jgi:hypothetical protein
MRSWKYSRSRDCRRRNRDSFNGCSSASRTLTPANSRGACARRAGPDAQHHLGSVPCFLIGGVPPSPCTTQRDRPILRLGRLGEEGLPLERVRRRWTPKIVRTGERASGLPFSCPSNKKSVSRGWPDWGMTLGLEDSGHSRTFSRKNFGGETLTAGVIPASSSAVVWRCGGSSGT